MSQFIPLMLAIEMTTLYRNQKEKILDPVYRDKNVLAKCETFDRDVFDALLAQPGCTGLRIYYGMDTGLKVHAIVVGVNSKNEDILPLGTGGDLSLTDEGSIVEEGKRCPDDCPPPSPLN